MKSHDRCVGADDAEFVYRVTLKPVTVNPGSNVSQYVLLLDQKIFWVKTIWRGEEWGNRSVINRLTKYTLRKKLVKNICTFGSLFIM